MVASPEEEVVDGFRCHIFEQSQQCPLPHQQSQAFVSFYQRLGIGRVNCPTAHHKTQQIWRQRILFYLPQFLAIFDSKSLQGELYTGQNNNNGMKRSAYQDVLEMSKKERGATGEGEEEKKGGSP